MPINWKQMSWLKKLYYKYIPTYEEIEEIFVTYQEADKLIKETHDNPDETKRWVLSRMEDHNRIYGWVFICRRKRIWE